MLRTIISFILFFGAFLSSQLFATEGAAGRYFVGAFASLGAGYIPKDPGVYFLNYAWFYHGRRSSVTGTPDEGRDVFAAKIKLYWNGIALIYVPKTNWKEFTLAFGAAIPIQRLKTRVLLTSTSPPQKNLTWNVADIVFTPLAIGWNRGHHHASFTVRIFAPTARYDITNFATPGENVWTFMPALSYSYINPDWGLDCSVVVGIDGYTRNHRTNYHSGTMSHIDVCVTKTFENNLGIGFLASYMKQISDDIGPAAKPLNGFRGRAASVGPVIKYSHKLFERDINMTLSWAPEFCVKNRFKGSNIYFLLSFKV